MKTWLRQHAFALKEALRQIIRTPGSFTLNSLVVAVALALPFAGLTVLDNVGPVSEQLSVKPEISVFLSTETTREQANALAPKIRALFNDDAVRLDFIPREKALETLKDKTGLAEILAALGSNPLPDAYRIVLPGTDSAADATRAMQLVKQLEALPGIDKVQIDSAWINRLAALVHLLRLALAFLAATLGMVVVTVIFNTIRLQVMHHREEIDLSRLVGATDRFIHRPFFYSGALLGLFAGALALGAVTLILQLFNGAIADFAKLYASTFQLLPLGLAATALLLAASALLGLMGAAISVRKY